MALSAGLALLPPLLLAFRLAGAVEVPGYQDKYPPLPGTERGSPESLVRNFEDVFEDELLEAMDAELEAMDELARGSGALRNSKRVTFWLGRERAPRCAIERAAKVLEKFTFPRGAAAHGIVGVKYWVQHRNTRDRNVVNFHYDKDEGLASDQMIMRPPPLVGVTHLEDWGAPTLMLNQSTIMNGNVDAPTVPTSGWLVYPRRNKHALHRGDLKHGAPHNMDAVPVPPNEYRRTLITSWEFKKPLEPNCHFIPDDDLAGALSGHSVLPPLSPEWSTFSGLGPNLVEVQPTRMAFDGSQGPVARRRVELMLGEVAHLDVLEKPEGGVSYYADWSGETGGLAFTSVYEMNLHDMSQRNKLFNSRHPVVVVFYQGAAQYQQASDAANSVTREVLLTGAVGAPPPIETYLADTESCADAAKVFRIRPKEAPIAVVHYTKATGRDRKFVMGPDDLPLSTESLSTFVKEVLGGERPETDVKEAAAARKAARKAARRAQELQTGQAQL